MIWSLPDYTAPPDAEVSFNQICGRNGRDVGLDGNSDRDEIHDMVMVERNGMVECTDVDRKESDVDHKERDVHGIRSDVLCSGSDVARKKSSDD